MLRAHGILFFWRVIVPLLLGGLLVAGLTRVTGLGLDKPGRIHALRNVALPLFIILVVWNAGLTIAGALRERGSKRAREVDHDL